jgi:FemAB-related protein (PEP-CTERM system-associated)
MGAELSPITVGLDPSLTPWVEEVKYVFRTLLRVAGYPYEFVWAGEADRGTHWDIYYGPRVDGATAPVSIAWCGRQYTDAPRVEPCRLFKSGDIAFLDFGEGHNGGYRSDNGVLRFSNDIIFCSYWLLTGAREPQYSRDRWDNLNLAGSFFLENSLLPTPLVSIYGSLLRKHFQQLGHEPLDFPWTSPQASAAFAFSHDVDYPQMIRWIECLRLLVTQGSRGLGSVGDVLSGTNHFWKFTNWVEFEKELGTRPAFHFMARTGSLLKYAMGTPDAFYRIHTPEFGRLFKYLREEGCEIALHASYNAWHSDDAVKHEKQSLEEAAGVRIEGNRNHYWHLKPAAPHETLRLHEQAGFLYDSSLAFEFYPGFRRGICHPFRVFHPAERREMSVVQLPPAWMDNHFDRRLAQNKIADPEGYAYGLVNSAKATGGVVVVDYHVRGMNREFYPRYGPWLVDFVRRHLDSSVCFKSPGQLAQAYVEYESCLADHSRDRTQRDGVVRREASVGPGPRKVDAVEVDFLQEGERQRWDAFATTHPHGTIYHTLAWKAVTEEGLGHRAHYLRAVDASGEFAGILPLFAVKGLHGRRLVSVPMRDRGGVLARDAGTASLLVSRAIELTRELNSKYLELRSLEEIDPNVCRANELHCERYWITTRIDLSPGIQQLWKALDKNAVRWAINKARKEGVHVDVDETPVGMDTFYEMFVRTRSSMGIPPFPKSLFMSIHRHLITHGKANLFLARKGSEPINGQINFLSGDTFIPAYAAPQNRWRKYYPSDVMLWSTIEWAVDRGFRYYDFGADSPLQTGLLRFKKKWGGVQRPLPYYYFLNRVGAPPRFDDSTVGYQLARRLWRLLPTSLSKRLGAWVTRQLS